MTDKDKFFFAAQSAAARAVWRMEDDRPEHEHLPELWEAWLCLSQYSRKHGADPDMKTLVDSVGYALERHLKQRMRAKGNVQKIAAYIQRIGIDHARRELVRRIQDHGFGLTKAYEIAAEILEATSHPAGAGADADAIRKSCKRVDQTNVPNESWALPGEPRMPALPDPLPHIRAFHSSGTKTKKRSV